MTRYLKPYQLLVLHKRIIDETGGLHGLRDAGLLDSSLHRPKASFDGEELYPTIFMKAGALFHSLIMNHPFLDGNKRTAFIATNVFLKLNGWHIAKTNRAVVTFTLEVVKKQFDVTKIAAWLKTKAIAHRL